MIDRNRLEQMLALLDRVRYPVDLSFDHRGDALAVAVFPAHHEEGSSYQSRIWRVALDGDVRQLTFGPHTDAMPRWSPIDDRLAFASEAPVVGRMSLFLRRPGEEAAVLGDIAGSVQQWHGRSTGARSSWWPSTKVASAPRRTARFGFAGTSPPPTRRSSGPIKDGGACIASMPRAAGPRRSDLRVSRCGSSTSSTPRRRSPSSPTTRPRAAGTGRAWPCSTSGTEPVGTSGSRTGRCRGRRSIPGGMVAVLEGWSSDRGLVAGNIRLYDLDSGERLAFEADLSDVTSVGWLDPETLWFAGWHELGSRFGAVGVDGEIRWTSTEDAIIGPNSFHARIEPIRSGDGFVAIRETLRTPPELVRRGDGADGSWSTLTTFNADLPGELDGYPDVRELEWAGAGGLPIRGLLMVPSGDPPFPTVVMIHGGPTWSWKYGFDPGYALPLAAAGFAIFLPNYRGSTGRGQAFTRLNVGDPAGDEFEDIVLGVDHCITLGVAVPGRIGVTGTSYGGYLTGWAVCTTDRFAAGVMVSGIVDMLSCHLTCNHAFSEFIFEGDHRHPESLDLFIARSPITHAAGAKTPTLILHGSEDRCTPPGQAEELYQALVLNGTPTELVVYPREGHGFREREHAADAQRRTVAWFERYLEDRG